MGHIEATALLFPHPVDDMLDFFLVGFDELTAAVDDLALGFDFGNDFLLDFERGKGD